MTTPEQILDRVTALGYHVMPRAYLAARHAMVPSCCDASHTRQRGARTWHSIDLASGQWNRWGHDGLWHPLSELPPASGPVAKEQSGKADGSLPLCHSATLPPASFVAACLQAGFVLDDTLQRTVDFGNRFARWTDGRRFLICEQAGQLTDCTTGDARSLEEFVRPPAAVSPQPAEPAHRPHTFISMRDRPLQMQGARVQTSLF